jgi:hypothetical protein
MKLSKIQLSSETNKPIKECVVGIMQFENYEQLQEFTTQNAYSPFQFKGKFRRNMDFVSADTFAIDIDSGLESLQQLEDIVKNKMKVSALIMPTRNNMKEKVLLSGEKLAACVRARVIFALDRALTSREEVVALFNYIKQYIPNIDEACKDAARFYYASQSEGAIIVESPNKLKVIEVVATTSVPTIVSTIDRQALRVEHGKLRLRPSSYDYFKNGAPNGHRHTATVAAAYDAKQQLWTKEEFKAELDIVKFPWMDDFNNRKRIDDVFDNPDREIGNPRLPQNSTPRGTEKTNLVPDNHALNIISRWLEDNNFKVSYDRSVIGNDGSYMDLEGLHNMFNIHLARLNIDIKNKVIESSLYLWVEEARHVYKQQIVQELCGATNFDNDYVYKELHRFLAVYKKEPTDLDVRVLAHQLWSIKKKLCNKHSECINPMMFILTGREQKTGKSWGLINYLLAPLKDLLLPQAKFAILSESNEAAILDDSFAINFDEMAKAENTDLENIKSTITGTNLKQRVMRHTYHRRLRINATFFGTSNMSVSNIIKDDTGMRRFYEVIVDRSRTLCEQDRLHVMPSIDYVALFSRLDHLGPSPIDSQDYSDQLTIAQEQLRHKKPVEAWLEDVGYDTEGGGETLGKDLLNAFNEWYTAARYNPTAFGREMAELGFKKRHSMKGNVYNIKLKMNSSTSSDY